MASSPNGQGKMPTWPNSYERDKRLLDGGVGPVRAPHKVLEAYMGEAGWPAEPTQRAKDTTSKDIGPTWGHGCLLWFGLL